MTYSVEALEAAHKHSSDHRAAIMGSGICGCFYCLTTFPPGEVDRWLEELSGTALCPNCGIDSVIGDASGNRVDDPAFLEAMHAHWFERSVSAVEVGRRLGWGGGPGLGSKPVRTWIATAALTVTGLLAGAWFVSPLCYWQGRTFQAGSKFAHVMPNWQPDLAPGYAVTLAIGFAWVILWFLHARRTWRRQRAVHAVLPAATFAFSALWLSYGAMACGAY